jgi:hypothetical protein
MVLNLGTAKTLGLTIMVRSQPPRP